MKLENKIIKYGLIITVITLILLLIIQPLNQTVFDNLEEEQYQIKNDIKNIKININYTKVVIKPSTDGENKIRYLSDNAGDITINETDDNLELNFKNKFKVGVNTMHLVEVSLNDKSLNSLGVDMEAGQIQVEDLNINKLHLDLNAGNILIKDTNLGDAKVIVGIGAVKYDSISGEKLNSVVEMGVSRLNNVKISDSMQIKNIIGKISGQQISSEYLSLSGTVGKFHISNNEKGKISQVDSSLGIGIKTLEIN